MSNLDWGTFFRTVLGNRSNAQMEDSFTVRDWGLDEDNASTDEDQVGLVFNHNLPTAIMHCKRSKGFSRPPRIAHDDLAPADLNLFLYRSLFKTKSRYCNA